LNLVEEILQQEGLEIAPYNPFGALISGRYIENYQIPDYWMEAIQDLYFKKLKLIQYRTSMPAFETDDGIFVLDYNSHLEKKFSQ